MTVHNNCLYVDDDDDDEDNDDNSNDTQMSFAKWSSIHVWFSVVTNISGFSNNNNDGK